MPNLLDNFQKDVENVRKTLGDLKTILDQLDKARSVVCIIVNVTDTPLTFVDSGMDHGGFAVTPPVVVDPHKSAPFSAQSASGGLFTGTEGWVRYVGQDGMGVRFHFDDPWAGSNSSDVRLDGNLGRYVAWSVTGNGDQRAEMQFVVYQLPFSVIGAIRDKWLGLGGLGSLLGLPQTDETGTPDGVGRFNHFRGGSIYWTPGTGPHEVHGLIREKWASMGWERSFLGYPVTDETGTPDGVGRFNHFQGGSIYWTPGTGAHEVHGAIRDKWASMGWERSSLGYPVTDEIDDPGVPGGRQSRFQHGAIHWTHAAGAIVRP